MSNLTDRTRARCSETENSAFPKLKPLAVYFSVRVSSHVSIHFSLYQPVQEPEQVPMKSPIPKPNKPVVIGFSIPIEGTWLYDK
jgi:hypothetical protein